MNPFIKTSAGLFVTASLDKASSGLAQRIVAALASKLQTEQKNTIDPGLWRNVVSNIPDLVQTGSSSNRQTVQASGETTATTIAAMLAQMSPPAVAEPLKRAVSDYLKPLQGIDSFVLVEVLEGTSIIDIFVAQITVNPSAKNLALALDKSTYALNLDNQKIRAQLGDVFNGFTPLSDAPYAIDISQ